MPSITRSPISKRFQHFFGSADQGRFFLKWPRTSLSNWRILIHLSLTTGLSSTNQNPTIIQACNRRNHEGFQLTDIFPLTIQCPHVYTRFHFLEAVQHNFVLKFHTHSLEKHQLSIEVKPHSPSKKTSTEPPLAQS